MEEGIGMLLWLALEIAVAGTGRVLVRVISRGNWRGQRDEQERRTHSAAGSLWFTRDGQRVFTQAGLRLFCASGDSCGFRLRLEARRRP